MAKICAACETRGKTWSGGDPQCAFPDGVLTEANWMCATMALLRRKVEDSAFWHDDHSTALIALHDNPRILLLHWYKSRGCTDVAKMICGTENDPMTEVEALEYVKDGEVLAISRGGAK
jgi:hypothetical protein